MYMLFLPRVGLYVTKFYPERKRTEHPSTCAGGISNRQRILHICTLCMLN
jgi:hypothetical protein